LLVVADHLQRACLGGQQPGAPPRRPAATSGSASISSLAPLVFFSVMLGISAGSLAERNDRLHVVGAQSFAQPAGIKSLVADQGQAMDAGHESVKAGDVVPLAWQEHEADQIAERIDDDRDLRRQAAARFADGLILSPPFAPVPC